MEKQNTDMELLRKQVYQSTVASPSHTAPIIVQVAAPTNQQDPGQPIVTKQQPEGTPQQQPSVTVRANKKKSGSPPSKVVVPYENSAEPKTEQSSAPSTTPSELGKDGDTTPALATASALPETVGTGVGQSAEDKEVTENVSPSMISAPVGTSTITFLADTNPDLKNRHTAMNSSGSAARDMRSSASDIFAQSLDGNISIIVSNDVPFDSLLFEMRNAVAEKVSTQLK